MGEGGRAGGVGSRAEAGGRVGAAQPREGALWGAGPPQRRLGDPRSAEQVTGPGRSWCGHSGDFAASTAPLGVSKRL